MDVLARRERLLERWHVGHMRRQPQFDLAVIGREQHVAGLGDERIADLAAEFGADRDVLQVGIGRTQPPGLRADQAVAGVDAPRRWIDRRLQRLGICRFELRQLTPFEHLAGHLRSLRGEPLEDPDVGRILAALAFAPALVAQLVEQDIAKLLGAADGERLACQRVDLGLQPGDGVGELGREPGQPCGIDLDPVALHLRDHRHQRAIDRLVHPRPGFLGQPRLEQLPQPPGDVRVLGGITRGAIQRDLAERDRLFAGAADVLERHRGVRKVAGSQFVHSVAATDPVLTAPGVEIETDHHRVVNRPDVYSVAGKDVDVVLGVLADLEHRIALEQRFQPGECLRLVDLERLFGKHIRAAVPQRDVARIVGAERKADPRQLGAHRVKRAGFGVECHHSSRESARDPAVERFERLDALVSVEIDCGEFGQGLAAAQRCRSRARRHQPGGMQLRRRTRRGAAGAQSLE